MKTKNIFRVMAMPVLAAMMLLVAACSSDIAEEATAGDSGIGSCVVPLTVKASGEDSASATRVVYDPTKARMVPKLSFEEGDQLFVRGVSGIVTFAGVLDYNATKKAFNGDIITSVATTKTGIELLKTATEVRADFLPKGYKDYGCLNIGYQSGHNNEDAYRIVTRDYSKCVTTDVTTAITQFSFEYATSYDNGYFRLAPSTTLMYVSFNDLQNYFGAGSTVQMEAWYEGQSELYLNQSFKLNGDAVYFFNSSHYTNLKIKFTSGSKILRTTLYGKSQSSALIRGRIYTATLATYKPLTYRFGVVDETKNKVNYEERTVEEYLPFPDFATTDYIAGGVYLVDGQRTIKSEIRVQGDLTLIFTPDSKLKIDGSFLAESTDYTIDICGTSSGSGTLEIDGASYKKPVMRGFKKIAVHNGTLYAYTNNGQTTIDESALDLYDGMIMLENKSLNSTPSAWRSVSKYLRIYDGVFSAETFHSGTAIVHDSKAKVYIYGGALKSYSHEGKAFDYYSDIYTPNTYIIEGGDSPTQYRIISQDQVNSHHFVSIHP